MVAVELRLLLRVAMLTLGKVSSGLFLTKCSQRALRFACHSTIRLMVVVLVLMLILRLTSVLANINIGLVQVLLHSLLIGSIMKRSSPLMAQWQVQMA